MHTYRFFAPVRRQGALGIFTGETREVSADLLGEAMAKLNADLESEGLELGPTDGAGRHLTFRVLAKESAPAAE